MHIAGRHISIHSNLIFIQNSPSTTSSSTVSPFELTSWNGDLQGSYLYHLHGACAHYLSMAVQQSHMWARDQRRKQLSIHISVFLHSTVHSLSHCFSY
jgi:hypothetical protein